MSTTAKAKTATEDLVNRYAKELEAKLAKGNFRPVPGFSNYAISPSGQVINRKTGGIQQIPKGKKKFLIFNDKKERKSISLDEIKALFPTQKTAAATSKKASGEKKEGSPTKKSQIVALHEQGKTPKEIAEITGFKYNSVYIMLRGFITLEMWERLQSKHTKAEAVKIIGERTGYTKGYIEWRIGK